MEEDPTWRNLLKELSALLGVKWTRSLSIEIVLDKMKHYSSLQGKAFILKKSSEKRKISLILTEQSVAVTLFCSSKRVKDAYVNNIFWKDEKKKREMLTKRLGTNKLDGYQIPKGN